MAISYSKLMQMRPEEYAHLAGSAGFKKKNQTALGYGSASTIAQENISDFMTKRYIERVGQFGARSQAALLEASPYLRSVSDYLQARFESPIPEPLAESYREQIRTAQAARGFGGGGSGVTGEEARYLMGIGEQQRKELVPLMTSFGQNMLAIAGMGQANRGMTAQEIEQVRIQDMLAREQRKTMKRQRTLSTVNTAIGAVTSIAGLVGGGLTGMAISQMAGGGPPPGGAMSFAMGMGGQNQALSGMYASRAAQGMYNQYMDRYLNIMENQNAPWGQQPTYQAPFNGLQGSGPIGSPYVRSYSWLNNPYQP